MKIFRNTAAVLVLTLFTGLAVFTAIQLGDRLFGTSDAAAQTANARSATDASSSSSGTTDQQQSTEDDYGYDQGSSTQGSTSTQDSTGTTQTCPATGCTASSCHATQ